MAAKSAPAYTFRGAEVPDHSAMYPGPGHYKPQRGVTATRPANAPVVIKSRMKPPAEDARKPSPTAYNPTDPLKMYKGEYRAVRMKFRCGGCCLSAAASAFAKGHWLQRGAA